MELKVIFNPLHSNFTLRKIRRIRRNRRNRYASRFTSTNFSQTFPPFVFGEKVRNALIYILHEFITRLIYVLFLIHRAHCTLRIIVITTAAAATVRTQYIDHFGKFIIAVGLQLSIFCLYSQ